ncbi:MAG TPA: hypothetical protein VJ969_07765 [Desulfopila sp.]|nr:hypothetical protein [Desulfopila sp.]
MSLKYRYALFLLLVLLLLVFFCAAALYCLMNGRYLATGVLLILLYGCTYLLGKRFARIFFVLSVLRLLRQREGLISCDHFDSFMEKSLGNRRTSEQKRKMKEDIVDVLTAEQLISVVDGTIVLLHEKPGL